MKDLNTTKKSLKPIRDDIVAVVIVVSVDVVVFEAEVDVQLLDDELLDMLVLDELVLDMLVLDERALDMLVLDEGVLDMLVLDVAVPWMCTPIYMSRLQIEYMYIYMCVFMYMCVYFFYIYIS
jgi:hypothetical protein